MKTLLQIEMYYVREYIPTCRWVSLIIFKNLQLECILHYIIVYLTITGRGINLSSFVLISH